METGDDRVLTSACLLMGYKTQYDQDSIVGTFAPDTISGFAKQRLRWSRSSFRETILSIGWLWKHPYAFFVMWADMLVRWLFLAVIVAFTYRAVTGNHLIHALELSVWQYIAIGVIGFIFSGYIKQIPHLLRKPWDFWLTIPFLLLNTFVLFPVEIYGNLTCLKQGWLTRNEE
jgi:hyaluronan synthase